MDEGVDGSWMCVCRKCLGRETQEDSRLVANNADCRTQRMVFGGDSRGRKAPGGSRNGQKWKEWCFHSCVTAREYRPGRFFWNNLDTV